MQKAVKQYDLDHTSKVDLWKQGLIPSFDGKLWRLHSGKDAKVVFEISKTELEKSKVRRSDMGYYIQTPENHNKATQLANIYGASVCLKPQSFEDIPEGQALICVVENGLFDAAGYCYSAREFQAFAGPDGRPRTWLLMNKSLVEKLTGFKE